MSKVEKNENIEENIIKYVKMYAAIKSIRNVFRLEKQNIVFHNGSNFDYHFIIKVLAE